MTGHSPLAAIPVVDIGEGGALDYALARREHARALRDECIGWMPGGVRHLMPVVDAVTRRWLARSSSPYVADIESIATAFGYSGIWFLNGCYQWGCTSLAREQDGVPWLARTLDWPFPGLGRRLEIARMRCAAGEFYNIGWPGYVGVLTGLAVGRFATAINQAPMWRSTRHPWLRPYDLARNAIRTWRIRFAPPDHLLREVFETCRSFAEARRRIETTPIARPAIFTLVGCRAGERCVIERTEEGFTTRVEHTASANDWMHSAPPWEARVRVDMMFTRSYQECAANSRARREQVAAWTGRLQGRFDWVQPPVLNPYTRLAVELCPATGALFALGFENTGTPELSQPVSMISTVAAAR